MVGCSQTEALSVRANPAYRLRSPESLGVDVAGVDALLVGEGLPVKAVDAAGAELFRALERPEALPRDDRVLALVLDGVLELETRDGFATCAAAWEALADAAPAPEPTDRLGRLARAALSYAERLPLPVEPLTARLYCHHRVPLSRRWTRAFEPRSVRAQLDGPALRREWTERESEGWLMWSRVGASGPVPYKLYVSPAVQALADVLPRLAGALTDAGARHFKVGPDAPGLLRPDKIVVYAADAAELRRIAQDLEGALAGVPAHGVPFTAQLAGDGLLSWGGDPAPDAGPVGGEAESWRLSVARRLAEALHAARRAPARRLRALDFALARLALDGVDVRSFAPAGLEAPR